MISCLIIFFFKDYIIRQFFISKIEYVDYDEYILTQYENGKKKQITYVGADFMIRREYDKNEELTDCTYEYYFDKSLQIQDDNEIENVDKIGVVDVRPCNVNNDYLMKLLKSDKKFIYKGTKILDNRKCYVLEFEFNGVNMVIYLDKELLFTLRKEIYENDRKSIHNYKLDLELKEKDIFKKYIK